ncbi:MAG TPA: ATP/GTP-binding protein [Candidatus Thermoplasmatota archaeon]|nr:ATP/GTP-binding protein [Candidatus Thermoplasmatota archaeon]
MTSLEEPVHLYAIGTAGSGKTRFASAFQRYLTQGGHGSVVVNLDPGAEQLPYAPDVDIRDWIVLGDVMDKYQLGPNGAQVVAADLLALRAEEIREAIESFRTDYVIFDTPGQTELFVFRESGRALLDAIGRERAMVAFLVDPFLAKHPSSFVAQLMLSATVNFRFGLPTANVLTKTDLIPEADAEKLLRWAAEPDELMTALLEERPDLYVQLTTDLAKVLEGMSGGVRMIGASSETLEGMEDVYAHAQNIVLGGEDLETGTRGD